MNVPSTKELFIEQKKKVTKCFNEKHKNVIPIINKTEFSKLQIPLPPLQEQEQIAEHLDFVFEKTKALKELYTKELKDYEELKQFLLDKAFKGEL